MSKGIDIEIGQRVRDLRMHVKISQTQLGKTLGVTFQQVQKYENGKNRISAASLYKISRLFHVDMNHFFVGTFFEKMKI